MTSLHFTSDEFDQAVALYRDALVDAKEAADTDSDRASVLDQARDNLYADDIDAHALIIALSDSDRGDRVWSLEEEILDAD
ncbi:hypothetical protein GCM10022198_16090 [Klugiella xanthotipulae]|uniref:Uncharacterized protein n=1 Tax=Klugiella xanthotipulae TaxID=244735 RepID=A0A543HH79_9MICO|nr:hypothetical protein [Klugiella xanthotipulae]TQM57647.1 hypothetical protein FB466_2642 [Klugiella xanthotipulae]